MRAIGQELFLATSNKGKITELQAMLASYGIKIKTIADFEPIEDPEETGSTFYENANLKAQYYAQKTGLPCLADDSGLCIDALDGAPGVFTARFAPTPEEGMHRINELLGNDDNRKAHFACCLVVAFPDGDSYDFTGYVHGAIATEPRGTKGFAYDPIFIPEGHVKTFGEMERSEKAELSHRANALKLFLATFDNKKNVQDCNIEHLVSSNTLQQ